MDDSISRQDAIDALKDLEFRHYMEFGEYISEDTREVHLIRAEKAKDALQNLPSAHQEPAIPLSWIENYIEWLKSLDNPFSTLTAMQISTMIKKWKDKQDECKNMR